MKRSKKSSVNPDAWLATYGDMVTLLLCFFVLLYSMSSIDSVKWEEIVKSFNPDAENVSQVVIGNTTDGEDDVGSDGENTTLPDVDTFEQLFEKMQEYINQNNLSQDVDIFEGEDYVFITFRNQIFFDGNSAVLKVENEPILTHLGESIKTITNDVSEIKVFGHTNQANPTQINEIDGDRDLSSLRSSKVVSFLQKTDCLDPKKISGTGYGQWYPVAPFTGEENRQKNRRVEILISKNDAVQKTLEQIYEEMGQQIY